MYMSPHICIFSENCDIFPDTKIDVMHTFVNFTFENSTRLYALFTAENYMLQFSE